MAGAPRHARGGDPHPDDGGLAPGPAECRAAYVAARRKWETARFAHPSRFGDGLIVRYDGGYSPKDGKTYRCVWPAVWEVCLAHGLTPTELVEARFRSALSAKAPEPTDLAHPRIVEAAVKASGSKSVEDARRVLDGQMATLARKEKLGAVVGRPDPVRFACYTREGYNAPLARYLYALRAGRADLAAAFFPEAVAEFHLRRTAFEAFLLPYLPADVLRAADQLFYDTRVAGRTGPS